MKLSFIVFLCLLFSLCFFQLVFSQAEQDSLKKFQFIYDFSGCVKTVTAGKFNETSTIKMPAAIPYFGQTLGFGKPFNYSISTEFGIGTSLGYFFDSKKTFLSVVNYGFSAEKGFRIKRKVYVGAFAGWQNAISFCIFNHFIKNKSNAAFNQNNFIQMGCDFSIFAGTFSKDKAAYGASQLGIKFYYSLPLGKAYLTEGEEFFPNGIGNLSLEGYTVGIYIRAF